jgi:hypothetical protein
MSQLTTMQVISHLLVKIHKGQQEIADIKAKLDVLTNSHEQGQVDSIPSYLMEVTSASVQEVNGGFI